jgi:hypothetical protein
VGFPEQIEIVSGIERAFASLDRKAAEHASATRLLARLDKRSLPRLFVGSLFRTTPMNRHQ